LKSETTDFNPSDCAPSQLAKNKGREQEKKGKTINKPRKTLKGLDINF
jgi:hypothetical protein